MTRRLRIVHVTGCLDIGGQERLLVDFAKHTDRDRFELHFVSLGSRGVLADELEEQGWPVTALDLGAVAAEGVQGQGRVAGHGVRVPGEQQRVQGGRGVGHPFLGAGRRAQQG